MFREGFLDEGALHEGEVGVSQIGVRGRKGKGDVGKINYLCESPETQVSVGMTEQLGNASTQRSTLHPLSESSAALLLYRAYKVDV